MASEGEKPIRVAIVGSGMAGLVTAFLLNRDSRKRYSVTIFESGNTLSLDASSISITNGAKETSRIDLPMRAFAGGYYSSLKQMYDFLGIAYHSQPFLFEFAKAAQEPTTEHGDIRDTSYFVHSSNLHQLPLPRPNGVGVVTHWIEIIYLIICYLWFSLCCFFVAPRGGPTRDSETLEEYLRRIRLPSYFACYYLLPLISSVTTCPHQSLLGFPASDLIDYKRKTHMMPHYTVSNGVKTVQDKLIHGINYELSAAILAVQARGDQLAVSWKKLDQEKDEVRKEVFDKVVLAVAPNVVGAIYEPLRHYMEKIPTTLVESVVRKDSSPVENMKELGGDNAQLIRLRTFNGGANQTESFHVQPCGATVITCPRTPIDPTSILHSAKFTRVLRSPESKRLVNAIFDTHDVFESEKARPLWKNGDDNVWIAGGWCWDGMVLLEGCVVSAMRVAHDFGVEVPWRS